MKVLITGSSGFIGSHLTANLRAHGCAFDVIKRGTGKASPRDGELDIKWPDDIATLDLSPYTSVIHLATSAAKQTKDYNIFRRDNLAPIEHLLGAIKKTNPRCSFIFVSSQSAMEATESVYGKSKWEAENLIKNQIDNWTILKPGLVFGPGGKGLSNRMLNFVINFPIVPLIGRGDQLIQPISIKSVVDALRIVATNPERFSKKQLSLVTEPVSMRDFLSLAAKKLGKMRIFVPIPGKLIGATLSLLEVLLKNPPITKTNLLGLTSLRVLTAQNTYQELQIREESLEEILDYTLSSEPVPTLTRECQILYRQLFGELPSQSLMKRYEAAHTYCCIPTRTEQGIDINKILKLNLDVESIEYSTRGRKTLLSRKVTLLSYLAEIEPKNYERFINGTTTWGRGFIFLGLACLRAPFKLIKGKYLVWRHGLV